MSVNGVLRKDQLERSLHDEKKLIEEGILKEDNPSTSVKISRDYVLLPDVATSRSARR